jgi:hypothetical protein
MSTKKQDQSPQGEPARESVNDTPPQPQRRTKQALLFELIGREGGTTLEQLTSATGWLPHTVRAAITGLRKRGHDVQCQRADGVSRYTVGGSSK